MIDAHMHFNTEVRNPTVDFVNQYKNNSLNGAVLILMSERDFELFLELDDYLVEKGLNIHPVVRIDKELVDSSVKLIDYLENNDRNYSIKIHPRLSGIRMADYEWINEVIKKLRFRSLIIDDFFYGPYSANNVGTELGIRFALDNPDYKVVLAHFGGIKCLEVLMMTHSINNIYYDIALTINYLQGTSPWLDLGHCIRFSKGRVMLGSDYPEFSYSEAYSSFDRLSQEKRIREQMDEVCDLTAKMLFF